MKTQIIQLEVHDDIISTRDKMGWGQTSRIILVWPTMGRLLYRKLDLVLLQRHSISLGARLALVTREPEVLSLAEELAIPAFPSLRETMVGERKAGAGPSRARRRGNRKIRRKRLRLRKLTPLDRLLERRERSAPGILEWSVRPWVQIPVFIIAILAITALLIVLVPGAVISLEPRHQVQSITLPVIASPEYETPRLTGEMPARWITIEVEGRDSLPTSGKVLVAASTASGGVLFTNLTEQAVEVPQGTVLRTSGTEPVRFSTTKAGTVPAGSGSRLTLPVEALSPGSGGNVQAHAIRIVEGPLGLSLGATNQAQISNGSDQEVAGPHLQDREQLYQRMFLSLEETARQELLDRSSGKSLQAEFAILPSMEFSQALEREYKPEEAAPAEILELTLRLEFKALVIARNDLSQVVLPLLDAELPEGYRALEGTVSLQSIRDAQMTGPGQAAWSFRASRELEAVIPPQSAITAALGLPASQAADRLFRVLPLERPPGIQLSPRWWPYMPLASLRIEVR